MWMISRKTIKKISIIIVTSLIVLYFIGNLGLYIYLKKFLIKPETENFINSIPEKLTLKEADIEAETLYFSDIMLKFPFYKEDITKIIPIFSSEHELDLLTIKINDGIRRWLISFHSCPDNFLISEAQTEGDIKNEDYQKQSVSSTEIIRQMHYASLNDYSWWNLSKNLWLFSLLVIKAIAAPVYGESKTYDLKTPYLKGFFMEGIKKGEINELKKAIVEFSFKLKDKRYSISFINIGEHGLEKARDIVTTIQPVKDTKKGYQEMEAIYMGKDNARYPEELILLSMISLKGPSIENFDRLLKIMENKNYRQDDIERIKQEIAFLKRE